MPTAISVNLNQSSLESVLAKQVFPWLAAKVDSIAQLSIDTSPYDPDRVQGTHMRDTIGSEVTGSGLNLVGRVYVRRYYAKWVHEGTTGGQTIVPVRAKVLRWNDKGGATIFRHRVTRGSTPAQPWLKNAMLHVMRASGGR